MCALAEDWDLVPAGHNPCHGILKYPDVKRERFLSDTEYERLGRVLEAAERTVRGCRRYRWRRSGCCC